MKNFFLENFWIISFIIWIFLAFLIWFIIWRILKYKQIKKERNNSIKQSKSVILGGVYEKILPFLPKFPYKPKDMVFVGKGTDYIIFDWLSEGRLKKIIFMEVKSWRSQLNKNEKQIRNIILNKKVDYIEYRV
jgi:predicted Holliday junction resolvase-like endonuclease